MSKEWEVVAEQPLSPWDVTGTTELGPEFAGGGSMPISTITGKPVPTPREKLDQSIDAMASLLPIAGDIAGTVAAPQLVVPGRGAPLLARAIPGVANILSRIMGAGAGSVVGEVERQNITGGADPGAVMLQGAIGAGGEGAMSVVGAGWNAVRRPVLELAADATLSGGMVKKHMFQKIKRDADERAFTFIRDIAPDAVKSRIDDVGMAQAMQEAFDETRALYAHLKDTIDAVAEKRGGYVPLEATSKAMRQWYEDIADPALVKAGKVDPRAERQILNELGITPGGSKGQHHIVVRRLLRGEELSPDSVQFLLGHLYEKKTQDWLALAPETREARQTLKELIVNDLDSIGASAGKKKADEVFKQLKRYEFIKNLYDRAVVVNRNTGERTFMPYQFARNIYDAERTIRGAMPELWPSLKQEADIHLRNAERMVVGGRRLLPDLLSFSGIGSAALTGGIPVAEMFGAGAAWALLDEGARSALRGVFKYLVKPSAKGTLHMAGMPVELQPAHTQFTGELEK